MSVPYGAIRGKIWHHNSNDKAAIDDDTVRVLALHGWQDNCGTFDRLIPLLPTNLYIVAVDFPGHGLSSHLPAGCPYNDTMFVIELERIVQFLGWKDRPFTILGHSMGAAIAMFYACLYPSSVRRIISLDMIKPLTFPANKLAAKTREGIEQFLLLESKLSMANGCCDATKSMPPLYDHQEAIDKLILAHSVFGKITVQGAEILLKRGARPSAADPNKVYFTRDNRLKAILFQRLDNDSLAHYFQRLECQLLIVKAENGVRLDPDEISDRYIRLYREKCPKFDLVTIPGGHHVHLCSPENVNQTIIDFLNASRE
ncbi:serine hydrolase-like protein [Euroglyphus maynei]|uniref:Serine hydrolase-like protein n=1 Tax=Euroglyphus maynei TaxID=6958 RepID=A0A1Y3AZP5_EURMA|nr:serine hydrolase-like protein [Euroglyphus maynei]